MSRLLPLPVPLAWAAAGEGVFPKPRRMQGDGLGTVQQRRISLDDEAAGTAVCRNRQWARPADWRITCCWRGT